MEEVFIQMWSLSVERREYNLSILVSYINKTSFSNTGFSTFQDTTVSPHESEWQLKGCSL